MTEWERMQKGLVYNDFDQDLFNKRVEAKNYSKPTIKLRMKKLIYEIKS